jgi:hypothetical protein
VKRIFRKSFKQWKAGDKPSSYMIDQMVHPAYQRIIGLGPAALPLILQALQKEPDPWFWALEAITGEKIAIKSESYRYSKTVEAWLQWGRERGYLTQWPQISD